MARRKVKEPVEPWIWKEVLVESIDKFPAGTYGFVYEIVSRETGKKYIGKKQLYSYHTKVSKVFNESTKRWNKVREVIATESNWKDYFGSSVEVKELIKQEGKQSFERHILTIARNKKELTYREAQYQMMYNVLEDSRYINSNVLGKFFRSDFS